MCVCGVFQRQGVSCHSGECGHEYVCEGAQMWVWLDAIKVVRHTECSVCVCLWCVWCGVWCVCVSGVCVCEWCVWVCVWSGVVWCDVGVFAPWCLWNQGAAPAEIT